MSEPDPRLLERLFPGPKNSVEIQQRRNVSAAAAAPTGGSNKVRERRNWKNATLTMLRILLF